MIQARHEDDGFSDCKPPVSTLPIDAKLNQAADNQKRKKKNSSRVSPLSGVTNLIWQEPRTKHQQRGSAWVKPPSRRLHGRIQINTCAFKAAADLSTVMVGPRGWKILNPAFLLLYLFKNRKKGLQCFFCCCFFQSRKHFWRFFFLKIFLALGFDAETTRPQSSVLSC